jgi:hypothetical protein
MPFIADDILLERMTEKETYLSGQFIAIESKASYLLISIAILAALPPIFATDLGRSWGRLQLVFHVLLVLDFMCAAAAGGQVFSVFQARKYQVIEADKLIAWRDNYVADPKTVGYTVEELRAAIQKSLINKAVERIRHNELHNAQKNSYLETAYSLTALAGILSIILLVPLALSLL